MIFCVCVYVLFHSDISDVQGSSVPEIFQGQILDWVAISYSGDLSNPGMEPLSFESLALEADSLPLCCLGRFTLCFA